MMKKQWKGFVAGLMVATLIFGLGSTALAATVRQLNATYNDIKITLDGAPITPTDTSGAVVEPFIVDGTTYLPVRAVANALGLGVDWDAATQTVKLTRPGTATTPTDKPDESTMTIGQRNALKKAESYLRTLAFSYTGLIEQLEFEKFSHEDAVFAADNCGADWFEQAAKKATSYLKVLAFSKEGLIEQLEFDGFTHEQAVYGVEANGY